MKTLRALNRFFFQPGVLLFAVASFFSYPIVTRKLFFNHPEFINYYPRFRYWFLQEWLKGTFPKWNPYWGIGHSTDIEATIPIDLYSALEIPFGPKYHYFQAIQFLVLLGSACYAFRKLKISPWVAALSSLGFFFSPWVLHHVFMFTWMSILTGICFITPQLVLYFQTEDRKRLVFLVAAVAFTLLGTRPDFWMLILTFTFGLILFNAIFFRKWHAILPTIFSVSFAVVLHAWQIVPLIQILNQSGRVQGFGISTLGSLELYQRLWLSVIQFPAMTLLNAYGMGALLGLIAYQIFFKPTLRSLLKACLLFFPLAYYWCRKGLGDVAEMDGMKLAPVLLQAYYGFLAFQAATIFEKKRIAKIFYCLILFLFFMRDQGQVILSHVVGLTWIPTRDNFLFDFCLMALAGMALSQPQWRKRSITGLFFWLFVALAPTPYYSQWELKPAPPFFGKYEGLVSADEVIHRLKDSAEWRSYFTSPGGWEANSLRNQANEVTLYSSMINARFRDWAIYKRFGIHPNESWSSFPADYTPQTMAELPPKNTKGFPNNVVYWWKLRAWLPQDISALQMLGVKHIISERPLPEIPAFVDLQKIGLFYTARLKDPAPRAFVIHDLPKTEWKNFQNDLSAKSYGNLIEFKNKLLNVSPGHITRYEPHQVRIEAESQTDGFLVLTDLYHPFWKAKVNGQPQEIFPALYTFRGIKIPKGKSVIEMNCEIPFFSWGVGISIVCFSIWLSYAILLQWPYVRVAFLRLRLVAVLQLFLNPSHLLRRYSP